MSLDIAAGAHSPATLSIQYITAEIMPLESGRFSVALQATLLDERDLQFVGQDLANAHVETLDEALAVIRQNVAVLSATA